MKKNLFLSFILAFACLIQSSAKADLIHTETCSVQEPSSEDPSNIFSFRSALVAYNLPPTASNRACTENIVFQRLASFHITLQRALTFTGVGALRVEGAEATQVILDATHLPRGQCAIDVSHKLEDQPVTFSGIVLRVNDFDQAICGTAYESDADHPLVIQVGDQNYPQQCASSAECCTAQRTFAEAGESCDSGRGTCDAQGACVPRTPQCEASNPCCTSEGVFAEVNSSCTWPNGNRGLCTAMGYCFPLSVLVGIGTPFPTLHLQCARNSTCCDSTGYYQALGLACVAENGSAGACNGLGRCVENSTLSAPPFASPPANVEELSHNEDNPSGDNGGCSLSFAEQTLNYFNFIPSLAMLGFIIYRFRKR